MDEGVMGQKEQSSNKHKHELFYKDIFVAMRPRWFYRIDSRFVHVGNYDDLYFFFFLLF